MSPQKSHTAVFLVAGGYEFLGLVQVFCSLLLLEVVKPLYIRSVLLVLLVFSLWNRTGYDQRCTRIVYEHGIHLVHNRVMMLSLHKILEPYCHIVSQVVKTELVVCSERDIGKISLLPGLRIRLVLVYAVNAQAMELVQRAHPLGVSLCQVVVHCHHVHTEPCQSVQEHRKGRNQGLSFTSCHLGDLALVQNDTSDQLHIVMNHIPGNHIAASHPAVVPDCGIILYLDIIEPCGKILVKISGLDPYGLILLEPAGSGLHYGKSNRKHFIQHNLHILVDFLLETVVLGCQFFFLPCGNLNIFKLDLESLATFYIG